MRKLIGIAIRTVVVSAILPALFLLDELTGTADDANIGLGILLLALLLFVPMIWAALDGRRMKPMPLVVVWTATVVLATGVLIVIRAAWSGTAEAMEPDVAVMTLGLMAVGAFIGGLVGLTMRRSSATSPPGQD
ncbi:MAG: hypothetical protein H0U62_09135 [Actinobacteria bacterium]|jgi:hypothetical protein|nr:hypothetical protein [Actinomycetota bacterium]